MFFSGFTLAMHILLLAQDLQDEEESYFKPSYFFRMSVYFIFCLCVVVLFFDLVTWNFTFPGFFMEIFEDARDMYMLTIRKLL